MFFSAGGGGFVGKGRCGECRFVVVAVGAASGVLICGIFLGWDGGMEEGNALAGSKDGGENIRPHLKEQADEIIARMEERAAERRSWSFHHMRRS